MFESVSTIVCEATGAREARAEATLQRLWSGYGSIVRFRLIGAEQGSVIVKHVSPPCQREHPRGWATDRSHERKLRSYAVETNWYQDYAGRCDRSCRVPRCFAAERCGDEVLLVLEDLDTAGYPRRIKSIDAGRMAACLRWLAEFHATFLDDTGEGLWENGTYWHLETRPDELTVLQAEDPSLHGAAAAIDARLKASPCQKLVHGDAKLANFCFDAEGATVAAVDFQYVGRGCGMKDVAYFIGSCLDEAACAKAEVELLAVYFAALRSALQARGKMVEFAALEMDWRALYPVAWTDFHRFLKGWSPGHWKIHDYSERLAREVIASIRKEERCI